MKRRAAMLGENINAAPGTTDKDEVTSVLEKDAIRQMHSEPGRGNELSEALGDDEAMREEDEELEEEEEVVAAAKANR